MGLGQVSFYKTYIVLIPEIKKNILKARALKISLDYRFYDFVNFFENRR